MDEQRLIDLEIKISHQEALLEQLNSVVTQQQEGLSALETKVKALLNRMQDTSEDAATRNEKPPHY